MGNFFDWIRNLFARHDSSPEDDYLDVSTTQSPPDDVVFQTRKRSWLTRWTPGAQRERQIAWLQAGYSEMLTLMRGINAHLERQEDVQIKLVSALEQLPASLENLKNLGKAAEQQVEALALLREQLARSVQHDQQLTDSMNRFNQTLGLLDETARASGRTVSELVQHAREEDRLLHEMVQRSEKRFMFVTGLLVLVLAGFVASGAYFIYKFRSAFVSSQTAEPAPAASTLVPPSQPPELPVTPAAQSEAVSEATADVPTETAQVSTNEMSSSTQTPTEPLPAASVNASEEKPATVSSAPMPKKKKRAWFRRRPKKVVSESSEAQSQSEAATEGTTP